MFRSTWLAALSLLLVATLLSACGGAKQESAVQHFVIEAKEFSFAPAELTVQVGEIVEIEFKNLGSVEHDFNIESLPIIGEVIAHGDQHVAATPHDHASAASVHVMAKPGNMGHLIFTPSQSGEYLITCTIAGHKEAGMVGKLIVAP